MTAHGNIRIKRVYEAPDSRDGFRILVDRLWPRGLSRETARIDLWMKDIAPSTALRKWFAHEPEKWPVFRQRYLAELEQNRQLLEALVELAGKHKRTTLLYAASDKDHNNATVLLEALKTEQV